MPKAAGRWPSRDALVSYYEDYAHENQLEIRLETKVERVVGRGDVWRLETSRGEIDARSTVIATGKYRTPVVPAWPGASTFAGALIHSDWYRNANPYRGKRVLVVGAGASGFEIATQIGGGGAERCWLSIRTPPHIVHRDVGPFPSDLFAVMSRRLPVGFVDGVGKLIRRVSIGDLSAYGLQAPTDGIYTRVATTGMIPTVDGPYVDAIKQRMVEVVPAVDCFANDQVVLEDGSSLPSDAVIAATGYQRDLEGLVGHLGVLQRDGHPAVHGAKTHPHAPRLHFIGFTEPFSGNLRELRLDARRIAKAVARSAH